ncbi:MAG: helix-turn-helix transcriptional regulator [Acidobacteriota bacterium]|nr:helix-turn-helix transcriptional regulator [Acidobacteriota bacterium]
MYFQVLQKRLVGTIRERVRSGEITERGLARLSGVSQPHIHNVLKGVRILSPEFADQVLRQLKITILDLCERGELGLNDGVPTNGLGPAGLNRVCWIPKLINPIGPGQLWSSAIAREARYPMSARAVENVIGPVIATLAEDARMLPRFRRGDTVLLDFSEESRIHPAPGCAYVIEESGGSLVRYVRQGGRRIYLLTEDCLEDRERWDCVSLAGRHILEIVRARIVWMGRQMESQ